MFHLIYERDTKLSKIIVNILIWTTAIPLVAILIASVSLTFNLLLSFYSISFFNVNAQIFQEKEEIIKDLDSYESGVADDGSDYIYFDKDLETKASGEYTRRKVIYFVELDDGTEICNMWKILEPSSETNSSVAFFKEKYVEVDYMQWKDYENEILYDIAVEDEICIITAVYDNTK
ncbi:hypothetical protein [Christiangramia forsetii]|uniref:Uncharacterized protein n=2 Tax=Christiangramia forsetii TaxID=411153 RepID=A0M4L1_CHRFK|nr:hypothetical protein [Christiangramia forsetii]GGG23173.1 hypothetical protein GCM10011532_02870 [Christiangramia forsetii]CAL67556.1 hypothetical protein GFO_2600 [Christiangramia forsetii KT0803]